LYELCGKLCNLIASFLIPLDILNVQTVPVSKHLGKHITRDSELASLISESTMAMEKADLRGGKTSVDAWIAFREGRVAAKASEATLVERKRCIPKVCRTTGRPARARGQGGKAVVSHEAWLPYCP
jgi:hypothetical protein